MAGGAGPATGRSHGQPAWIVSRYQDIRVALTDPRLSAETIPDSIKPSGANDKKSR